MSELILASTSAYRRQLLQRLGLPFRQVAPHFEESCDATQGIEQLVRENTLGKGRSVLQQYPAATVIASDQLAVCGHQLLGKPGSVPRAMRQLRAVAGRKVSFLTGLAVLRGEEMHYALEWYHVYFRSLDNAEIVRYIARDMPLDCAGSFRSESLGIALLERMEGDDPTALIGLPLIRLSQWLQPLWTGSV